MNKKVRKSIDIPEKELKKLQILAVMAGVSIKIFLEKIIMQAAEKETITVKH